MLHMRLPCQPWSTAFTDPPGLSDTRGWHFVHMLRAMVWLQPVEVLVETGEAIIGIHVAVWWLIVLLAELNGFTGRGQVTDAVSVAAQARRRAYGNFWRRDVWKMACRNDTNMVRDLLQRPRARTRNRVTAAVVFDKPLDDDEFDRVEWRGEEREVLDDPDYLPCTRRREGRTVEPGEATPPVMGSYGRVWTHRTGRDIYRKYKLFAWGYVDPLRLRRRWATVEEVAKLQGLPDVVADGTEQGVAHYMLGNAVQRAQAHRELCTLDAVVGVATGRMIVSERTRLADALRRSEIRETDAGQRFELMVEDPMRALAERVHPETPPTQRWRFSPGPRPDGSTISPTCGMGSASSGKTGGSGSPLKEEWGELPETQIYPTQEQELADATQQPMAPTNRREEGDC